MLEVLGWKVMGLIERFLSDYWQYGTLILGAGFIIFGIICNKIKLPRCLTNNPDATYSLGLRFENCVYITRYWCIVIFPLLHYFWMITFLPRKEKK